MRQTWILHIVHCMQEQQLLGSVSLPNDHDTELNWYFERVPWYFERVRWYFERVRWYFEKVRWYFERVCWYFERVCWYFEHFEDSTFSRWYYEF